LTSKPKKSKIWNLKKEKGVKMEKKYLSTKDVEMIYGLSEKTQGNLRHKRKITYSKIGKNCVYLAVWVEEYINKNMVQAAS